MSAARIALLTCISMSGCGSGPQVDVYTGAIEASDARIAIATDGERVTLYACGGKEEASMRAFTVWYRGPLGQREWKAQSPMILDLVIGDRTARGTLVDLNGAGHAFSAQIGGRLFSTVDRGCRAGVIVDPRLGSQGVWCDSFDDLVAQVDPGAPMIADREALDVRVAHPNGDTFNLLLEAVDPSDLASPP